MIKTFLAATAVLALALPAQAVTVVQWDFESAAAPSPSTSWTGISASTGTGTASGVHASSTTWTTVTGNGSAKSTSANTWAVGDYWSFTFSTVGYSGLSVSFDETGSNTGPRDFTLAYSTNGVSFTNFASYSLINGAWTSATPVATTAYTYDLSAITALNNAAAVTLRLVDTSATAINGGTVAGAGTSRVDNFTVNMTAVPEPETYAMFIAGFAALGFMARRRQG